MNTEQEEVIVGDSLIHTMDSFVHATTTTSYTMYKPTIPLIDITQRFRSACQQALGPGDLCSSSWFNLLHAMSAIEIMDPKMDIRAVEARPVLSVTKALETNALPLGPFDENPADLLGIMDEVLCSLVNWLSGDSLAQTVFICMYMHCTQLIKDARLAAFCELIRRSIRHIRQWIVVADTFDDEDHFAATHGVPLQGPDPEFNSWFTDTTSPLIPSDLSSSELVCTTQALIDKLPNKANFVNTLAFVRVRLEFAKQLFMLSEVLFDHIAPFTQSEAIGSSTESSFMNHWDTDRRQQSPHTPISDIRQFWTAIRSVCLQDRAYLSELNQLTTKLLTSAEAGTTAGCGRSSPRDHAYGLAGFEPFLNQTKLPTYIPRFVVIHDRVKAFQYLNGLTEKLLRLTDVFHTLSYANPDSNLHLLWSIFRANGQTNCGILTDLLHTSSDVSTLPDRGAELKSCILSRTLACTIYSVSLNRFHHLNDSTPVLGQCVLDLWLSLEAKTYHSLISTVIEEIDGLREFFDVIGEQLSQIPQIYCFNRSRQRPRLTQWLQRYPDLLEECLRIEWIVAMELSKKLEASVNGTNGVVDQPIPSPPQPPALQLTSIMCYYYYQLAWDYVISGFQLDLYSPHEWIFHYTFMTQLFQQLSSLLERFVNLRARLRADAMASADVGHVIDNQSNISSSSVVAPNEQSVRSADANPMGDRARKPRKKRQKRPMASGSNENPSAVEEEEKKKKKQLPPYSSLDFCGPHSEVELLVLTVHRFITMGTMYVLRALQLDSGGDPVLDVDPNENPLGRGDPVKVYSRRLGLFLQTPNSPLVDSGGAAGAFQSCRLYVTTGVFNAPTSELYERAAASFENARFRAQLAQAEADAELQALISATSTPTQSGVSDLSPSHCLHRVYGAPDTLSELDLLAKHNAIACRVLANCPDRRPCVSDKSQSTPPVRPRCLAYLHSTSPVRLEWDQLPSRTYPLIRLVSVSKQL